MFFSVKFSVRDTRVWVFQSNKPGVYIIILRYVSSSSSDGTFYVGRGHPMLI